MKKSTYISKLKSSFFLCIMGALTNPQEASGGENSSLARIDSFSSQFSWGGEREYLSLQDLHDPQLVEIFCQEPVDQIPEKTLETLDPNLFHIELFFLPRKYAIQRALKREEHQDSWGEFFSLLPLKLIHHTLSYLDGATLGKTQQISRAFYQLSQSDPLWKRLAQERKGSKREVGSWKDYYINSILLRGKDDKPSHDRETYSGALQIIHEGFKNHDTLLLRRGGIKEKTLDDPYEEIVRKWVSRVNKPYIFKNIFEKILLPTDTETDITNEENYQRTLKNYLIIFKELYPTNFDAYEGKIEGKIPNFFRDIEKFTAIRKEGPSKRQDHIQKLYIHFQNNLKNFKSKLEGENEGHFYIRFSNGYASRPNATISLHFFKEMDPWVLESEYFLLRGFFLNEPVVFSKESDYKECRTFFFNSCVYSTKNDIHLKYQKYIDQRDQDPYRSPINLYDEWTNFAFSEAQWHRATKEFVKAYEDLKKKESQEALPNSKEEKEQQEQEIVAGLQQGALDTEKYTSYENPSFPMERSTREGSLLKEATEIPTENSLFSLLSSVEKFIESFYEKESEEDLKKKESQEALPNSKEEKEQQEQETVESII